MLTLRLIDVDDGDEADGNIRDDFARIVIEWSNMAQSCRKRVPFPQWKFQTD